METIEDIVGKLGVHLRAYRIDHKDRQTDFALRIGVSLSTLRAMESGEPGVSISAWMKAWSFLGKTEAVLEAVAPCTPEDLFAEIEAREGVSRPRQRVRKG